jgi:hypothetical protein
MRRLLFLPLLASSLFAQATVYLRASGPAAVQVMGASNNGVSPMVLCTGNPPVNASTPCAGTPLPHNFPTTCGTSTTCYCNPEGLAITTGNHASSANGIRECKYEDATHLSLYYVSGSPYSSPVTSNGNWHAGESPMGGNAALQQVGLLQAVNTVAAPAGWLDGPTGPVMRRLALTPLNGLTSLIFTGCPSACVAAVTTSYDPTTGNFPIVVGGNFSITGTGTTAIDTVGTGTLQTPYTVASISSTGWVSSPVAITGATNGNYTNSNLACGPAATPNDTIGGTQSCTVISQIATAANAQWSGMLAISTDQHTDAYPDYKSYFDGGKNPPSFGLMGLYQVAALELLVNRSGAAGAFWLAELEYAVNNVEREAGVNWSTFLYAGSGTSQYSGFSPPGLALAFAVVQPYMSAGNVATFLAKTYNNLNDPSVTPCDTSGMLDTNYDILGSGSSAVGNATSYTLQTDPGLTSLVGNVIQFGTITNYYTYGTATIATYNSSTKVATFSALTNVPSTTYAGLSNAYAGFTQLVTDAPSSGNCTGGGGSSTAFCAWNGSTYVATRYTIFATITIASTAAGVSGATTTVTGINTNFTSTLHVGDGILGGTPATSLVFSGLSNYESYVCGGPGGCGSGISSDTVVTVINSTGSSMSTSVPSIYYYLPKWNSSTNTMCGWEWWAQSGLGFFGSQPIINPPGGGTENVDSNGPGTGSNNLWPGLSWAVLDTVVAAATGGSETRATSDLAMTFGATFDYGLQYLLNSFSGFGQSGATYDKDENAQGSYAWVYFVTQSFPTYPSMDLTGPWATDGVREWMFGQYPDSNGIDSGYSLWYLQYTNQSSVASIGYPGVFGLTNAGMSLSPALAYNPAVCATPPNCPAQYYRNYLENATSMSNRWGENGMTQEVAALQVLHNSPTIVSTEYRTQPPQYAFIQTSQPTCASLTGWPCPVKFHQDAVISRGNTSGETYRGWSNQADTLVYHGSRSALSDYYGPGETTLGIYKNQWLLYDDVSTPGQVPTGYDLSIIGDTPCIGACPVGFSHYTQRNNESVYGRTPAMMPIYAWSSGNHGSWPTSYGDQNGNYACDMSDISGLYDQLALGITIDWAHRGFCHSKQAGQDEFVFDFLSVAAASPTVMETHLHYLNNGQTQATPTRTTGTTTYLGGGVIESVQSGGQIGTAPAQSHGLMTYIYSPNPVTVADDCVGHGGGQCAPGDTYPGGIGYSHRFTISGGASVGASVGSMDVVICHHIMKTLTDTTFSPVPINPDANWTGVQCGASTSSAVMLFARGGVTHANITGFTTTHSGTAQYLFAGLTPGSYAVTIGGTPVSGSPFTVAANDNSIEFESTAGSVSINGSVGSSSSSIISGQITPSGNVIIH